MFKICLIILWFLNIGIFEKQDTPNIFDIQGKWYIKETIYLNTNDTMNITFNKCPYFEFNSNGKFKLENGMNIGSDSVTWVLQDSNIFFINKYLTPIDTSIFNILSYDHNYMSLQFNEIQINLSRICDEK
jgi:hypothetical protein